ncbi:MAG: LicD family protein, partial [Mobilitalea sp.]
MAILHSEYANDRSGKSSPSPVDLEIRKIIEQNNSEDYTEVLAGESRWEIFSELSQMRTSLLNWYEFKEDAELLEIGGGFGALTSVFCDRCAHVTVTERSSFRAEIIQKRYEHRENLDIYAGELEEIPFEQKFDYITIIGLLEYKGQGTADKNIYADYIRKVSALLKPEGKILIAVENRYGLRYFCGARDPHTGRPFDGINRYHRGTTGYSFSKQELTDVLNIAGINYHKFYYPLPDYKLSQMIYTDSYLPEKNLQERLIPYYVNSDTLIAQERDLYDDLIDNHVFSFFANSFLVEGAVQEDFCSVIYAAVSTDRGRENGFATTIHTNHVVKKTILYQEGEKNLQQIFDNIQDLDNHGIPVVLHTLENNALWMPYVEFPTLSIYMRELIKTDQEQFEQILDQLYKYILASSEHLGADENVLITEETKDLDWGVILKKAYIELIPLNCFYGAGQFFFFDQEFVKNNYPAKYILFRAIHYMYGFAPHADSFLPLQKLKDKYGLTELWEILKKEEGDFLTKVRRHNIYTQFYQWAQVDGNRIQNNVDLLSYKGEKFLEYKVPPRLKKIQEVQRDLLVVIKEICERNHLQYFMIYGTLLGAVRHDGFIPWDDDIDIALPREDYDQLMKFASAELKEPYFLQTPENDTECFYGGYSKLRNSNTSGIENINWGKKCNHGIWIDIFPLDACYSDQEKNRKKLKKICFYQRLLFAKVYRSEKKFRDMGFLKWKVFSGMALFYKHNKLCILLEKVMKECEETETKYLGIYTHYTSGQANKLFFKEDFKATVLMDFEHLKLPAPVGYKRCLEMSMGSDYMSFPSMTERKPHHQAFFAPNVPYKAYFTRFMEAFTDTKDKTIVLFGAGCMCEDYLKKQGKKHPPECIVDNNAELWG